MLNTQAGLSVFVRMQQNRVFFRRGHFVNRLIEPGYRVLFFLQFSKRSSALRFKMEELIKLCNILFFIGCLVTVKAQGKKYIATAQLALIVGPPTARHCNGVSLAGHWWPVVVC